MIRSEWTKLWSLRSTRWTLLVAILGMVGLGPLIATVQMNRWNSMGPGDRLHFNPIDTGLGGYHFAQLAIGVLGVLVLSGEYSTGSDPLELHGRAEAPAGALGEGGDVRGGHVRADADLGADRVPRVAGDPHRASRADTRSATPPALRAWVGTALYLTVLGVLALSLGAIVRNTAGGIALFAGLLFVVPGLAAILPTSTQNAINPYLPSVAGTGLLSGTRDAYTFSPWGGFALFCGYTVLALVIAAFLMKRRDA